MERSERLKLKQAELKNRLNQTSDHTWLVQILGVDSENFLPNYANENRFDLEMEIRSSAQDVFIPYRPIVEMIDAVLQLMPCEKEFMEISLSLSASGRFSDWILWKNSDFSEVLGRYIMDVHTSTLMVKGANSTTWLQTTEDGVYMATKNNIDTV